jgi:SWIM zinc finger
VDHERSLVIESSLPEPNARASDQDVRAATNRERIAEAVETELERLREARPALESRIDRASSILLLQLASPPRTRPVRVRIHGDEVRFLVSSSSAAGAVYAVDAKNWVCSCPDFHRRNVACKHVLASWVLKQAARIRRRGCAACVEGWVYLAETIVSEETGEATEVLNPVRCRRCWGVEPPYLTDEELERWMEGVPWRFAKTMPRHPHSYTLRREQDEETFLRVIMTIWDLGYDRSYLGRPWRSLDVGGFYVWVHTLPERGMSAPLKSTVLVNRAPRIQERLV